MQTLSELIPPPIRSRQKVAMEFSLLSDPRTYSIEVIQCIEYTCTVWRKGIAICKEVHRVKLTYSRTRTLTA